jgi:hypothetical protein
MRHIHVSRHVLVALALLLTGPSIGCKQQLEAKTEYAEDIDFSKYQTYRWITDDPVLIQAGSGDPAIRTLENEKRIRAAVDRGLAHEGLQKVDGADADLIIAFTVGTRVRYKLQGGGGQDLDLITGKSASVTRGQLTLYLFDQTTARQIWSAWTKKDLEPGSDPDAVINAAVTVLLQELPR